MAGEKSRNTFTGLTVNSSLLTSQGPWGLLNYAAARLSPAPPHSLTPPLSRPQHLFTTLLSAHFLVHWAWDAPRRQEWILTSMCFSLYLPNTCLLSVFLLQVNTFLRWEALLGPRTPVTQEHHWAIVTFHFLRHQLSPLHRFIPIYKQMNSNSSHLKNILTSAHLSL